jgi:Tfp pilus assembly protein FimT
MPKNILIVFRTNKKVTSSFNDKNILFKAYSLPHEVCTFGFTVIELLIVVVTMVLLFTIGFANFRGTQKRQELSSATQKIKTDLRYVQELALSNRSKPATCTLLRGYKLKYVDSKSYKIYANCNSGASTTDIELDTNKIDISNKFPDVTFSSFSDIIFLTLGRGVETSSNIVITVTNSTGSQTITITKGGEIN